MSINDKNKFGYVDKIDKIDSENKKKDEKNDFFSTLINKNKKNNFINKTSDNFKESNKHLKSFENVKEEVFNKSNSTKYYEPEFTKILFNDDEVIKKEFKNLTKEENIVNNKKLDKKDYKKLHRLLPKFIKNELIYSKISLFFNLLLLFLVLLTNFIFLDKSISPYYAILTGFGSGIFLLFSIFSFIRFKSIIKEIKNNNYVIHNDVITNNIRKIYSSLIIWRIKNNWFAFTSVVCSLWIILWCIITAFLINKVDGVANNYFGDLLINGSVNVIEIIVIFFGVIACAATLFSIVYLICSKSRISNMDSFFNVPILLHEDIKKDKKSANRFGLIFFSFTFGIISIVFIALAIWILKRRKRNK